MGNYSIDIQKKALKYDVKQKTARFNRAGRRIFGCRKKRLFFFFEPFKAFGKTA